MAFLIGKSVNLFCKGNACCDKNKIISFIFVPKTVYCNNITIAMNVKAITKKLAWSFMCHNFKHHIVC